MARIVEMMLVFQDLNNFNGVFAVTACFDSSSVHRLEFSFEVRASSADVTACFGSSFVHRLEFSFKVRTSSADVTACFGLSTGTYSITYGIYTCCTVRTYELRNPCVVTCDFLLCITTPEYNDVFVRKSCSSNRHSL